MGIFPQFLGHLAEGHQVVAAKLPLHRRHKAIDAGAFDLFERRQRQVHHRLAGKALELAQAPLLPRRQEQDGLTGAPCPTRTTDTVHVRVCRIRSFDVDHQVDEVDIEATRRHIRGHQDAQLAVTQPPQHRIAGRLSQVAVHGLGRNTAFSKQFS